MYSPQQRTLQVVLVPCDVAIPSQSSRYSHGDRTPVGTKFKVQNAAALQQDFGLETAGFGKGKFHFV